MDILVFLPIAGVENPAFMPDMDTPPPPWLTEDEADPNVAPSQRAQRNLPWSPNNLHRLAPLRISDRSTDSFMMAGVPAAEDSSEEQSEEPPQRDGTHM